ncbi:hypothetical protein [Kitasatospora sp. NPDC002040]|uniref:hypothetical protein n=1 Tax=Kitasatospora sp. NPDC002040 TaxID=3154661 RepID=UPI00332B489F
MGSGLGEAAGPRPEVRNSLSDVVVVGPSIQAGTVHGGVHLHLGAEAGARSAAEAAAALPGVLATPAGSLRRRALEQLLADLEAVHRDYLVMFEAVRAQAPAAWEQGSPGFAGQVRSVAGQLRHLRLVYEPVRVRVRATAEVLERVPVAAAERAFAEAVLGYFPTGELGTDEESGPWRTSGTAVLDHLYRALDGELGQELGALLERTLTLHRHGWSEVCRAYAVLQLGGGAA